MAFLNVQQTFTAGQPGMSPIKITANGIELPLGEAEMKIFKRSAHAALPLARTYRSLAVRFARHTQRAC